METSLTNIFPHVLFPLANLLICISLVFLISRAREIRKEFRFFAVTCIIMILWSAIDVCSYVLPRPDITAWLSYLRPLAIFLLPLTIHLVHQVWNIQGRKPVEWIAYFLALLAIVMSWTDASRVLPVKTAAGLLAFSGAAYCIFCFRSKEAHQESDDIRFSRWFLAAGSSAILLLLSADSIFSSAFSPLSLSFIPVVLISAGLVMLQDNGENTSPKRIELIYTYIITFLMIPLMSNLLFIAYNFRYLYAGDITSWLFHRTIITIVSLMVATFCALLSFRKAEYRTEALLYSVICLLTCILNLRDLIITILPDHLARQIIPINDIFLVNLIGICAHLILIVCRKVDTWRLFISYAAGIALIPVLLYESYLGKSLFAYDPLAYKGLGHFLFIAFFLFSLFFCTWMLAKEWRSEIGKNRKKEIMLVLIGIVFIIAVLIGSMITSIGLSSYPFYNLAFVALLFVGNGVFHHDIQRINIYTRRQLLSQGLRLILIFLYSIFALGIINILKDYPLPYILDRLVPYGIPPLLSFASAAFLSLFVLGLEKNRPESQLFSLICFSYTVLNLDICLLGIVKDANIALFISRIDHFFLTLLLLGVNLNFAYLVIGKKDRWWIVYAAYILGFIMAPLSQTDYYFNGLYTYYWGYFARKAILYDIISGLWSIAIAYAIYLLYKASRSGDIQRRSTVRHVLVAFVIIALLSLSNNPAIYGFEIYPMGTFIFIALFFLAYGLFKFNFKMALQYVRGILFWSGLVAVSAIVGLVPAFIMGGQDIKIRIFSGILLVSVLYHPLRKGWNTVLDLFIRKSSDALKERYYRLTNNLSRIHHREKIHQMLCAWFFEVLEGSSFISLFSLTDLSGQRIYFGWKTFNSQNASGLFGNIPIPARENLPLNIRKDHLLIEICRYEQAISTKESLLRMNPSLHAFNGSEGLLKDTEIVIPVVSKGNLLAVMLLGRKADGSPYSRSEFDILRNISVVLGPQIENAMLLEELEEKVEQRTRELNSALVESVNKEKEIRESSDVITRQNQIFRTLLQTSTSIHNMESLDDLFAFILSQLHTLFMDFRGGIILENKRRSILEATSFIGISEAEQKVILSMRDKIMDPEFGNILNDALVREGIPTWEDNVWTVFPMEGRSSKIMGYMIFKGQVLDRQTKEIFMVFLGQLSAVTQNKLLMIQLEKMASTDGMTGLYNRAFLNQELRKVIMHSKRFKNIFFSVMIIDVNGLKKLNDTYGHEKGDEAIIKVAGLLKSICRTTDIVSRLGGDEFAILMPSTNYNQAEILYRRIIESSGKLEVTVSKQEDKPVTMPVHISVGLAGSDDIDPDDVMKKADALMYTAKEQFYAMKEIKRG